MTAESDITAINDGGGNTALEVRSALTSVLARADSDPFLTTKGDLLVYTTEPARLAVGADGTALIADSGESAGVRWGSMPGRTLLGTTTLGSAGSTIEVTFSDPAGTYDELAYEFYLKNASGVNTPVLGILDTGSLVSGAGYYNTIHTSGETADTNGWDIFAADSMSSTSEYLGEGRVRADGEQAQGTMHILYESSPAHSLWAGHQGKGSAVSSLTGLRITASGGTFATGSYLKVWGVVW